MNARGCQTSCECPELMLCMCLLPQTNNPRKIQKLKALGINISGRIPSIVEAGEFNQVGAPVTRLF